jgi:hypothetical protein
MANGTVKWVASGASVIKPTYDLCPQLHFFGAYCRLVIFLISCTRFFDKLHVSYCC